MKRFKNFLILVLVITGLLEVNCAYVVAKGWKYKPINYENQYKAPLLLKTKIKIIPEGYIKGLQQWTKYKGDAFVNSLSNSVKKDLIKNVFPVIDEKNPKIIATVKINSDEYDWNLINLINPGLYIWGFFAVTPIPMFWLYKFRVSLLITTPKGEKISEYTLQKNATRLDFTAFNYLWEEERFITENIEQLMQQLKERIKNDREIIYAKVGRHLFSLPEIRKYSLSLPSLPFTAYILKSNTEVLSVTGRLITKLPAGFRVNVKEIKEDMGFVESGRIKGWVSLDNLSLEKPDILNPIVHIIEKRFNEPNLYLKGVVYDDKKVKTVKFGDEILKRAKFSIDKGNYGDAYPFEKRITITPRMKPVIVAKDISGNVSKLPVLIEERIIDYTPEYVALNTKTVANLRKGPGINYKVVSKAPQGTQLTAIGYKGDWFYLETGLWVNKKVVEEIRYNAPLVSPSPVVVENRRKVEIPKYVDVDVDIPRTRMKNPDAVAVIIGNKNYERKDVPPVDYAIHDAEIVKEYFINAFGIPEDNIIFVKDAKQADFNRIFGTKEDYKGQLYDYIKQGKSDIYVYYAGHGAPNLEDLSAYFVPVDADPRYVKLNGYPLSLFYRNLKRLPARSVTVIIDACFSGGSGSPEKPMLIAKASPIGVVQITKETFPEDFTIITAGSKGEIASWYPEKGHSLFTYYFLKALKGEADVNKDKIITLGELKKYLKENVPHIARKLYHRNQNPEVKANPEKVLVKLCK